MDYFTIDNEKIYIDIKDDGVILKKHIDNELVSLSDEERNNLINKLSNDSYIYYSIKLKDIITNNESLRTNIDYYYNLLSMIEKIIPEQYRNNFYRNLKTLKIHLNIDEKTSDIKSDAVGCYNPINNEIILNYEENQKLKEISKINNNPDMFFWTQININLVHELLHMASIYYDKENNIELSGFDKFPCEGMLNTNRGLTEGMTEVLACMIVPGSVEISCGYYIEEGLVNQLALIVGAQVMIDSYFGNLGTKEISRKLNEIDKNFFDATMLFQYIELNYQLKNEKGEQTILGKIQYRLVEYFQKKIVNDIYNGLTEEEIRNSIYMFKCMLVTNKVLIAIKKDPNDYPNLNESLELFSELEKKVNRIYSNRGKDKK